MVEADLVVSQKLKNLLPPLSEEEREQLEKNIVEEGRVRDAILYWHDGKRNLIVDGMNRYEFAKKHKVPFRTEPMVFANQDAVELWMLNNALGRRNLMKPNELRRVRGELYNRLKGESGNGNGKHPPKDARGQNVTSESVENAEKTTNSAKAVAEKTGVSERTVKRDGKFAENLEKLSPPLRKVIEEANGKVTDKQVQALAKADPTQQQQVARAVRTGAAPTLADAMKSAGVKARKCEVSESGSHSWVSDGHGEQFCEHCKEDHPDNGKAKKKPGREVSAAKLVDKLTKEHVGKVVRGLDGIATALGGKGPVYKEADAALNTFIACLKRMKAGER